MQTYTLIIIILIATLGTTHTHAQQKKEYATVYMKVWLTSNTIIYDPGVEDKYLQSPQSPVLTMPDGKQGMLYDTERIVSTRENGQLDNSAMLINYMATFGWELKSSNVTPYSSRGDLAPNAFIQLLIFERNKQ